MRTLALVLALPVAFAGAGCLQPQDCADGQTTSCACSGGMTGTQTCGAGSFGACDCPSTGSGSSRPTAGETCTDPGTLRCGIGPDGRDAYALSCPVMGGTYTPVFQCPLTQSCYDYQGRTSIACGSGPIGDPSFKISYAVPGSPCAAEQAASCNFDQSQVLQCQQGIWIMRTTCSGTSACDHAAPGTVWGNTTCPSTSANGCIMCNTGGGSQQTCPSLAIGCASSTCNGNYCGTDWTGNGLYCAGGKTCAYQSNYWTCCD